MNPASNPFILPGLGQAGDTASNPLMASLEMMRDAWQRMAGLGGADGGLLGAQPLSVEEMDKRIAELRAVENWLRLNLSMLTSSIQGLEVQRATLNTLKAFATNPSSVTGGMGAFTGASQSSAAAAHKEPSTQQSATESSTSNKPSAAGETDDAAAFAAAGAAQAAAAAQGWWDMLQQQFNSLAAATAASLQTPPDSPSATASKPPAGRSRKTAGDSPPRSGATKSGATKSARKTAGATATGPRKRTRST